MTLQANTKGEISGRFTIPANVRAGTKNVQFEGEASTGSAIFRGQGILNIQTFRNVTTTTNFWQYIAPPPPVFPPVDPLAQTFTLSEETPIIGVDLWFTAKGDKDVTIQLRQTTAGFPNRDIIISKVITAGEIQLGNVSTRIIFDTPITLPKDEEYAIVVLTDCNKTALAIAELGQFDQVSRAWVTAQPYNIGVLLSSSNASTWTAHQDKDLAFQLLKAEYTASEKSVSLGEVDAEEVTDLMLLAMAHNPTADTRTVFVVELPDGTEYEISENQAMRLPKDLSGKVKVRAKLIGNKNASPTLISGSQLLLAHTAKEANYISRSIKAGTKVKVIFEANIPAGAGVDIKLGNPKDNSYVQATLSGSQPMEKGLESMCMKLIGHKNQCMHR